MVNFFLLVKNFLNARWIFIKPKKKKYLVYDFANSNYLFKYIKREESAIYHTRWETINFFIIFHIIINYGFKNLKTNYKKAFLSFVSPKIAITLSSSYVAFYKLKILFPNIITIVVQDSLGNQELNRILKSTKKNTLSCDYFFFFSESFKRLYKKYILIKKKSLIIGSFRNNYYTHKSINKKKIIFISKYNWNNKRPLNEIILLKLIIKYLKNNKLGKVDICLKSNNASVINYFKQNLNLDYINIIPKKNSYTIVKDYENIIFTDSTLGYECLARGKKVISFGLGSLKKNWCIRNGFEPINKFGYPNKFKDDGFFWSNASSEKKINKLLRNILRMKQSTFNKKINTIKDKIICFDPKNTKFKRLLCAV
jgi:surface carbohydrate biosynthesis protein